MLQAPRPVPRDRCHTHRPEAPRRCSPTRQGPTGRGGKAVGFWWVSVERPRPEPSPGREAQRAGEAENPGLNKQLETVRFNQE